MTEAILIEIAQRFRKMEDVVEKADLYHADNKARMKFSADSEALQDVRDDLEKALEACREDMTTMQEFIRKCQH